MSVLRRLACIAVVRAIAAQISTCHLIVIGCLLLLSLLLHIHAASFIFFILFFILFVITTTAAVNMCKGASNPRLSAGARQLQDCRPKRM